MTTITVEKLVELGGRVWERGEMRRVYFNYDELAALYGLEYDGWKWTVDGEKVSNNSGHAFANSLRNGKFWYDLVTGQFASRDMSDKMVAKLIERITESATEEAAEAPATEAPVKEQVAPAASATPAATVGADLLTSVGYGLPPGTKVRTNRRPGYCRKCGQLVPADEGHLYYIDPDEAYEDSGWIVEHKGACPTR